MPVSAQRGVGRIAFLLPLGDLVLAQVDGADHHRVALHRFGHLAVGLELFVLGGQVVLVAQEQELGAEQADAAGALGERLRGVGGQLDIGQQLDLLAVARHRLGVADVLQCALAGLPVALAGAVFHQHLLVGVDDDHAVDAIDDDQLVLADQRLGMAQRQHRRQVEAARQDGGVRGGAADVGDEGVVFGVLEQHHVGGRQVVRHQDAVRARRRRGLAVVSGQRLEDAVGHLDHVGAALAQVFLFDLVELRQQDVELLLECPFGVAVLGLDDEVRLGGQRVVVQQHDVQAEEGAQLGGGMLGNTAPQRFQLLSRQADGAVEAGDFLGNVLLGDGVVRDLDLVVRDHVGVPDGDASADADAVQRDAHPPLLARWFTRPRRSGPPPTRPARPWLPAHPGRCRFR